MAEWPTLHNPRARGRGRYPRGYQRFVGNRVYPTACAPGCLTAVGPQERSSIVRIIAIRYAPSKLLGRYLQSTSAVSCLYAIV